MPDEVKKVITIEKANEVNMLSPGELVAAPVVSAATMATPGVPVVAPIAPATGTIPVQHNNVVVSAKDWFKSSTIWTSIVLFSGIALDTLVEEIIPLLQTGAVIQWKPLLTKVGLAVAFAYMGLRRKSDNSVIK